MLEIQLTKNQKVLVDKNLYEDLNKNKWYTMNCSGKYYAARTIKIDGKKKTILMHRYIMNAPKNKVVDHINGNTLDNRIENLRICSHKENIRNSKKCKNNTSGYTGVFFYKRTKRWQSCIGVNNKIINLGYYDTKEEAALAYNEAAIKYFGEFAKLNEVKNNGLV